MTLDLPSQEKIVDDQKSEAYQQSLKIQEDLERLFEILDGMDADHDHLKLKVSNLFSSIKEMSTLLKA